MQELFLLQKVYGEASLEDFGKYLKSICGDLSVSFTRLEVMENGWVGVQASGRDERVAVHLLEREVGLAPVSANNVERFSLYQGRVISSGKSRIEIFVDIGVFSPKRRVGHRQLLQTLNSTNPLNVLGNARWDKLSPVPPREHTSSDLSCRVHLPTVEFNSLNRDPKLLEEPPRERII